VVKSRGQQFHENFMGSAKLSYKRYRGLFEAKKDSLRVDQGFIAERKYDGFRR